MAMGFPFTWHKGEPTMKNSTRKTLLRGALYAALAFLTAADPPAGSGTGSLYALVFGLMATIFGGTAFCYGLVKLAEKIVHTFHPRHAAPVPVRIRHAA